MLEMLESGEGVIALKITGRLEREELERVTALLEASLAARAKTHIFVEIEDYRGFDPSILPDYLPHAAAMLGKLDRFGRVAVVSDQRWIRWLTKLESALLPHISYETFTARERTQALDWVEGRSALPHGPSLRIIETDKSNVMGFELDGRITSAEIRSIAGEMSALLGRVEGPVRVLGRFVRFASPEMGAFFDDDYLRMKLAMLDRVERYAVVGGPGWLRVWVAALAPVLKVDLRHFEADQEAAAWQWLGARPKVERPLAA